MQSALFRMLCRVSLVLVRLGSPDPPPQEASTATKSSCPEGTECLQQGDLGLSVLQQRMIRGKFETMIEVEESTSNVDIALAEPTEDKQIQNTNVQVRAQQTPRAPAWLQEHELHDITTAVSARPHLGGWPEEVEFAIYVKDFFGLHLRQNLFAMDIVLTLRWIDPRITKLLPAGAHSTTISLAKAKQNLWLPDIVVSNKAISGQQEISAAVDLYRDGKVVKTQRLKLSIQQHFEVAAFPFDQQTPEIMLCSETLMSQDLVMKELDDEKLTGIKEGLFSNREFHFVSAKVTVFEEVDANLKKSRGVMAITLKRDGRRYLHTTIFPEIFLVLISFTVFWMPRNSTFAMPRVATTLISCLTLMTLSINTAGMLPPDRADMAWIELFGNSMQMQNCLTLFLNVFVDWVYSTLDLKELGETMTREQAGLFPLMGSVVVLLCFVGRSGENLERLQTWIRLWGFGVQSAWICYSLRRVHAVKKTKQEQRQ